MFFSLSYSLGFVGLCWHNFERNTIYIVWSIRHNGSIILIFLQRNAVSENCEKCIQILPATSTLECIELIKVGKVLDSL